MNAIVDFCLVPLSTDDSLAPFVAVCKRVLDEAGLKYKLHANGTGVEGELSAIFAAIERCHEESHRLGTTRVFTTIRVGTRSDLESSIEDKLARARGLFSS